MSSPPRRLSHSNTPSSQSQQRRSNKNKKQNIRDASELLNFRLASRPTQPQPRRTHYKKKKNSNHHVRYTPPRDFPLYASSQHGFILKPGYKFTTAAATGKSPTTISWKDDVWMVRVLVRASQQQQQASQSSLSCPICLSADMVAPRVTKCGHVYCLPCLLRYTHYLYTTIQQLETKCPCCNSPMSSEEWKPILQTTIQTPTVGCTMQMIKLHIKKQKSPFSLFPYLPMSNLTCLPCLDDTKSCDKDAIYCRFNTITMERYRFEIVENFKQLQNAKHELVEQKQAFFQNQQEQEQIFLEMTFCDAAMEYMQSHEMTKWTHNVDQKPIATNKECPELNEKRATATEADAVSEKTTHHPDKSRSKHQRDDNGVYLQEDETQFYQAMDGQVCFLSSFNMKCLTTEFSTHAPQEQHDCDLDISSLSLDESAVEERKQNLQKVQEQEEEPPSQQQARNKSTTTKRQRSSKRGKKQRNKNKPLPSVIEGRVLNIQSAQLTPNNMKRFAPWLHQESHNVPLYMDVLVVELDLHHVLSPPTKQEFQKEFRQKKQARQKRKRAEKRLQQQMQQEETELIKQRKEQLQDAALLVQDLESNSYEGGEEVFPSIVANDASLNTNQVVTTPQAFRFSQVCATNGVWPALNASEGQQPLSPLSSPTHNPTGGAWGSSRTGNNDSITGSSLPSLSLPPSAATSDTIKGGTIPTKKEKKKRKAKIVLFSTGGGGYGGAAY